MLPPDELEELTARIAANGLREPLVIACIDGNWMLVDGHNRCEACRLAGIHPAYRILDAAPFEYVMDLNIHRRHLTQGQRAMVAAKIHFQMEWSGFVSKQDLISRQEMRNIREMESLLPVGLRDRVRLS